MLTLWACPADAHGHEIDAEAQGGDDHHAERLDLRRLDETAPAFGEDVEGHAEQQHRVDGGGQDLEPLVAEGAARVGRPLGDAGRGERDRQRRGVGEHVRGVR
jgi:hypothetical protein